MINLHEPMTKTVSVSGPVMCNQDFGGCRMSVPSYSSVTLDFSMCRTQGNINACKRALTLGEIGIIKDTLAYHSREHYCNLLRLIVLHLRVAIPQDLYCFKTVGKSHQYMADTESSKTNSNHMVVMGVSATVVVIAIVISAAVWRHRCRRHGSTAVSTADLDDAFGSGESYSNPLYEPENM